MNGMQSTIAFTRFDSPLGPMIATAARGALTGLYFTGQRWFPKTMDNWRHDDSAQPFAALRDQLDRYWSGTLTEFDLPLDPVGTDDRQATAFQLDVWKAIYAVPLGATITYSALAIASGRPPAVRAAGAATGRNPISVIIPCHRIVGSDGSLTGYAGGLDRKRTLLAFEKATANSAGNARPIADFIAAGREPAAASRTMSATLPLPI